MTPKLTKSMSYVYQNYPLQRDQVKIRLGLLFCDLYTTDFSKSSKISDQKFNETKISYKYFIQYQFRVQKDIFARVKIQMKRHFKFDNHFGSEYSVMFLLRYYFDNLILISYVILLVRISTWYGLIFVRIERRNHGP